MQTNPTAAQRPLSDDPVGDRLSRRLSEACEELWNNVVDPRSLLRRCGNALAADRARLAGLECGAAALADRAGAELDPGWSAVLLR